VPITIPKPLYRDLSEIIKGSGFNYVIEFVFSVLRDPVSSKSVKKEPSLSKAEIEAIKKSGKSLGYLYC